MASTGRNEVTWSNWVVQSPAAGAVLHLGATSKRFCLAGHDGQATTSQIAEWCRPEIVHAGGKPTAIQIAKHARALRSIGAVKIRRLAAPGAATSGQHSTSYAVTRRGENSTWSWLGRVDRLGRSLQDLVGFLSELHALKIDLFLRQQGLDTTTPAGKAMFQMMGVFAEFERAMIAERVRAGLARARSEGKRLGRPPIAPTLEKRIREALATPGRSGVRVIAERFGVNVSTVQRISRPFVAPSVVAVVP
jgi:Resolvase, N terminal domain